MSGWLKWVSGRVRIAPHALGFRCLGGGQAARRSAQELQGEHRHTRHGGEPLGVSRIRGGERGVQGRDQPRAGAGQGQGAGARGGGGRRRRRSLGWDPHDRQPLQQAGVRARRHGGQGRQAGPSDRPGLRARCEGLRRRRGVLCGAGPLERSTQRQEHRRQLLGERDDRAPEGADGRPVQVRGSPRSGTRWPRPTRCRRSRPSPGR